MIRARLAERLAAWTAAASRLARRGDGTVVGGRVLLAVDPDALRRLAAGRTVALVSATNGKTTTSRLLAGALRTVAPTAANARGSNLPSGIATALLEDPSPQAVLEVDEQFLGDVAAATAPRVVVLGNLSRDQLDRVGEVAKVARRWRTVCASLPPTTTVVANADDPQVAWAARAAADPVWVAAGTGWRADSPVCPACGALLASGAPGPDGGDDWSCPACDLRRPTVAWWLVTGPDGVSDPVLRGPDGFQAPVRLALPGRANLVNAALAAAGAVAAGVDPATALTAARDVTEVAGRYRVFRLPSGAEAQLLLAKNPAGWTHLIELLEADDVPTVVAVNARAADGRDTSWLWDVPFERLAGRDLVAAGDRRTDLALRLEVAGARVRRAASWPEALASLPAGPAKVVCNYTAMRDAVPALEAAERAVRGVPA